MESTRAESLRSQRGEALKALRERHGSDAVERAAFAFFAGGASRGGQRRGGRAERGCRRARGEEGSSGEEGGGDFERFDDGDAEDAEPSEIPVSVIAKALRPAYGPDCDYDGSEGGAGGGGGDATVLLAAQAVDEAVLSECGIDCSGMGEAERQGIGLRFEEFRAVAERLIRRKR